MTGLRLLFTFVLSFIIYSGDRVGLSEVSEILNFSLPINQQGFTELKQRKGTWQVSFNASDCRNDKPF